MAVGDAFDCDINGDGTFDATAENTMKAIGNLDSCHFLFENSNWGASDYHGSSGVNCVTWWLENVSYGYTNKDWYYNGATNRYLQSEQYSETYCVRPAIEVLKTDISY